MYTISGAFKLSILVFTGFILSTVACRPDLDIDTNPELRVEFSQDSIRLDTIFSSLSSITVWAKVFNPNPKAVRFDQITIAGGSHSPFRFNIEGQGGTQTQDPIVLRGKDSLFIFISATVDPNDENLPFEIFDYLQFHFNGKHQDLVLSITGQNAYFHRPTHTLPIPFDNLGQTDTVWIPYSIVDPNQTWPNDKPHVIYGYLMVEEGSLELEPGTRMHFSNNGGLWIKSEAKLHVKGSTQDPVIFEGIRMDSDYRHDYGQWDRIYFESGSQNNRIENAIIRNGRYGLDLDSNDLLTPTLLIKNTRIINMQYNAIAARHCRFRAENLVLANSGYELLLIQQGGYYELYQCSLGNYFSFQGNSQSRVVPALSINNKLNTSGTNAQSAPLFASFHNSIIYGNQEDEIDLKVSQAQIEFKYCNIRQKKPLSDARFNQCIFNVKPGFKNTAYPGLNFDILLPDRNQSSGTIAKGDPSITSLIPFDILNRRRRDIPSIGAYEFYE